MVIGGLAGEIGEGPPRSGGVAKPLDAGTARELAKAGARGHGPRAAGVGPRGLCPWGGAARPVAR